MNNSYTIEINYEEQKAADNNWNESGIIQRYLEESINFNYNFSD